MRSKNELPGKVCRKSSQTTQQVGQAYTATDPELAAKNLEGVDEPRLKGKALVSNHSGEWRYRIGYYRLIADIQDEIVTILIIAIGHRKDIY